MLIFGTQSQIEWSSRADATNLRNASRRRHSGQYSVFAESRIRHVPHEPHSLESNSGAWRKTEEGRIVRAEIHHTEITERQLEAGEHLEALIRVLALSEVFDLLRVASAFFARRNLTHIEDAKAKWAVLAAHRCRSPTPVIGDGWRGTMIERDGAQRHSFR